MSSSRRYDKRVYDTTLDSGCGLLRVLKTTTIAASGQGKTATAEDNGHSGYGYDTGYTTCDKCGTRIRGAHSCGAGSGEGARRIGF